MDNKSPVLLNRMSVLFGIILMLSGISAVSYAQGCKVDTAANISRSSGDDISPAWSPDGTRLLYQSNRYGNWDIFMYDIEKDTTVQLTSDTADEQNPGFYPGNDLIIYYDAGKRQQRTIYKLHTETALVQPACMRKIACKKAVFSSDGRMMYFLGFNEQRKEWALYSYHFVYDVLNELSDDGKAVVFLDVSPDAKTILFGYQTYPYPFQRLGLINWYGEQQHEFDTYNISAAAWHPEGLKIYFVSDKDNLKGELYSIWRDGTHVTQLTDSEWPIKDLAVSPDGSTLACSLSVNGNYEIIIISPASF